MNGTVLKTSLRFSHKLTIRTIKIERVQVYLQYCHAPTENSTAPGTTSI